MIYYEFTVERIAKEPDEVEGFEIGDILDIHHFEMRFWEALGFLRQLEKDGEAGKLCLVRDHSREGRTWAYFDAEEGRLESHFRDASGEQPMRYRVMVRVQFPAWDEQDGIFFDVEASSKSEAIRKARRLNAVGGQVHREQGRAVWSAEPRQEAGGC